MYATETLTFEIEDLSGQIRRRASGVPRDATVAEMVNSLSQELGLPELDVQGRPILYGARTSRGDVLNASDRLGDVIENEEVVTLTKSVTAG